MKLTIELDTKTLLAQLTTLTLFVAAITTLALLTVPFSK
jgi:hypothetical protein